MTMQTAGPTGQPASPEPREPTGPEADGLAPVEKEGAVRVVPRSGPSEPYRGAVPPSRSEEGRRGSPAAAHVAFLRGFVYAGRGLWYVIRTQRNMRVHLALGAAALLLGAVLRISPVEFAVVVVAIMGVTVTEVINTVVEAAVDLATQEYHALARTAKDAAAGAVLLSAILSVVVGLFVFVPHLWPLLLHLVGR
jgi:diacylglycerol kinase